MAMIFIVVLFGNLPVHTAVFIQHNQTLFRCSIPFVLPPKLFYLVPYYVYVEFHELYVCDVQVFAVTRTRGAGGR